MEEGLFTLLFILFMVAAAVMDAVTRKRKRQQRMEEMEAEEPEDRWDGARTGGPRGSPPAGVGDREGTGHTRDGERETADSMIPDDFWAILTGEDPREREGPTARTSPPPTPPETAAPEETRTVEPWRGSGEGPEPFDADKLGRRGDPDPFREPHIPMPTPWDRMSVEKESADGPKEERSTRRSARWMEGKRGREGSARWSEGIGAEEARVYQEIEEPWGELEDIAAGDLTGPGEGRAQVVGAETTAQRRRTVGPRAYTHLVESGDVEDLRKAVVLREILDRPVAFRDGVGPDW